MSRSLVAAALALAACNAVTGVGDLSADGTGDGGPGATGAGPGGPNGGDLDGSASGDGASAGDGRAADGGTAGGDGSTKDGAADSGGSTGTDAGCGSLGPAHPVGNTSGAVEAHHVAANFTLDGMLDADWGCIPFVHLDPSLAPRFSTLDPQQGSSIDFAIAWDATAIYVALHAKLAQLRGNATGDQIFRNSGVEIYFDGDGNTTNDGQYGPNDGQLIVDYLGHAEIFRAFTTVSAGPAPATFTWTMRTVDGTDMFLETRYASSSLGSTTFTASKSIGFDMALDDGDGNNQLSQMGWYSGPSNCGGHGCTSCTSHADAPYCNTTMLGTATLVP